MCSFLGLASPSDTSCLKGNPFSMVLLLGRKLVDQRGRVPFWTLSLKPTVLRLWDFPVAHRPLGACLRNPGQAL